MKKIPQEQKTTRKLKIDNNNDHQEIIFYMVPYFCIFIFYPFRYILLEPDVLKVSLYL